MEMGCGLRRVLRVTSSGSSPHCICEPFVLGASIPEGRVPGFWASGVLSCFLLQALFL